MLKCFFLIIAIIPVICFAQEKAKPRIDLQYLQEETSIHFLKVLVRTKKDKRFDPVVNQPVKFYTEQNGESVLIGTIVTSIKGEGKLRLSDELEQRLPDLDEYLFTAEITETDSLIGESESITIVPGRIIISTDESAGRNINISVQFREEQSWKPMPDVETKVFIKRVFGQIQVGEDIYTTDENGIVELPFENVVPGDESGAIILGCSIEEHDELGSLFNYTKVSWGTPVQGVSDAKERTLWATRDKTPIWLLIFPNLIIAAVWGVITYLILQIFRIKRVAQK